MKRQLRIRNNKKALKEKCENNFEHSVVNKTPENTYNGIQRIILKDKTNVLQSGRVPLINSPLPSTSDKYGLRRNNIVNYKKLSNGVYLKNGLKENKEDVNSVKPVTPKSANKFFKSVSSDTLSADSKSNTNNKVTPALKTNKPIYNFQPSTSRIKESMPVEKKLAIYEFEVDENEPKIKKKKKRARKVVEKKKFKEQNKKVTAKKVASCLKNPGKVPSVRLEKLEDQKRVLSTQNSSCSAKKNLAHEPKQDSLVKQKENFNPIRLEVPVVFHNHQNATPVKTNISMSKPVFTAMSDDERDESQKDQLDISLFSTSKRTFDTKEKILRSSFSHDFSYDYQVNASTPVKYNHYNITGNSSSIDNCFGFDEPEVFEEPLISPIKNKKEGAISNYSGETIPTSHKLGHVQDNNERKEEIPVNQVIKMLKYGIDDSDNNSEIKSRSSVGSISPIFNDPVIECEKLYHKSIIKEKAEKSVKSMPRRSYERPSYLRKKNKSFEEDSGSESDEDKRKKTLLPKKKQGPSKKENEEMQKWIKAFNSQCQEVEKFDLVVE